MPLVSSALKQGLLDLVRNYPQTPFEAGRRWASAYASYARAAISPAGGFVIDVDAAERVLGAALGSVFANPRNPTPATASSLASAFTAFWFAPPVAFTAVPPAGPGVVTLVGGTAALPGALLGIWESNLASRGSDDQMMEKIASAIDAFTHTVIVTHVVPAAPPIIGPIS